ncbi:flagellar basal body-associated FliL family protein [Georgenia sp. H159]|uniref:flagellar basal body-associated FliL family protein n=1 Tax=Georgenia sp. H159 TaxID=3076115 RepID=UPI002D7A1ED7|nr:flagellar basal body-associated FliL family protein [Georgenia sp. H159]
MSATRVIAPGGRKIGGGSAAPPPPEPPAPPLRRRRRSVLLVLATVLVAAAAVTGYLFLQGPADVEPEPEAPEPGITVAVEPRNINLADGRYLRMGFAIQLAAEAEEIHTEPATDIAISLYSGLGVDEVNDPERRAELKAELTDRLVETYGEEVLAVYLTDFVTQ